MKTSGLLLIGALFLAGLNFSHPACGAGKDATVRVSATILPWLRLQADQSVANYKITSIDLERGYVDLPRSATVRIKTNENKTVGVSVSHEGPERILVREAGFADFSGTEAKLVIGRSQQGVEITKNLDFRIVLPKEAKEGTYPLNIAISPYIY